MCLSDNELKRKAYLLPLSKDALSTLFQPNWITITNDEFNFYLGTPINTKLLITPKNQALAHQRLLAHIRANPQEFLMGNNLLTTTSLGDFFEEGSFVKPIFDEAKNIIGLEQGGDCWVFWELEMISDLVETGSFILIQDDGAVFWKVIYSQDGVRYFREDLENKCFIHSD